eukprot:m.219698 g.219698  ORF g.219698 m.219698 type:complete len:709 (+) comp33302_c0_seq1:191-2317(+)
MANKREAAVVPPELASFVSKNLGKELSGNQRDSIIGLYGAGFLTLEQTGAELQSLTAGSFKCKFLGSVPVAAAKLTPALWDMFGKKVMSTAFPKIKALKINKSKDKGVDVILSCTRRGIRVIEDNANGTVLEDCSLNQVEFWCIDPTDKKRFGYFTHYSRLGLIFCHLFAASASKTKNDQILKTIEALVQARPKPAVSEADKHEKTTGQTLGIFEVRFLGQLPLKHLKDLPVAMTTAEELQAKKRLADAVTGTLKELKISSDVDPLDHEPVILVVSSEGIRAVELASRETLTTVWIEHIVYTSEVIGKRSQLFTLISKDQRAELRCYIFSGVKDEATQICDKLNEAKQVFKEDREARNGNPFMQATSLVDEPVPGVLSAIEIPRRDLTAQFAIGAGQFGEVYLGEVKKPKANTTVRCAVKMLRGGAAPADKELFVHEAEINTIMQHPNIVAVIGVCFTSRPWLVVLELCTYGDLQEVLRSCLENKFAVRTCEQMSWAIQLASALDYVAQNRFVHMDVAARNIMVDVGHRIKLGDFGLAHPYDDGKKYYVMRDGLKLSIRWLCVEIMGPPPKIVSEKSDVWSFGVTLWEIFTLCKWRPFHRHRLADVQPFVRQGGRLPEPKDCPDLMYKLMQWCWQKEPKKRPTFTLLVVELRKLQQQHTGEVRDVGKMINRKMETELAKAATSPEPSPLVLDSFNWEDAVDALDSFDN